MKSLIQYDEYGPGMGFPSMKESFRASPYPGEEKIAEYLDRGKKTYAATGCGVDVFTGERIDGEKCGMTDGEYSWSSTLSHYVRTYHLKLPEEFENKVLESGTDY